MGVSQTQVDDQVVGHTLVPGANIDNRVVRGKARTCKDLGREVRISKLEVRQAAGSRRQVLQYAPHVPLEQGFVLEGGVEEGVAEVVFTLV